MICTPSVSVRPAFLSPDRHITYLSDRRRGKHPLLMRPQKGRRNEEDISGHHICRTEGYGQGRFAGKDTGR